MFPIAFQPGQLLLDLHHLSYGTVRNQPMIISVFGDVFVMLRSQRKSERSLIGQQKNICLLGTRRQLPSTASMILSTNASLFHGMLFLRSQNPTSPFLKFKMAPLNVFMFYPLNLGRKD